MAQLIHYSRCPVCNSTRIKEILHARDFTVSSEMFQVMECEDCGLRFTQDVPDELSIGPYYRSQDYISHTNTSKGLVNRLYQLVRGITMRSKARLIRKASGFSKAVLLDIGSGTGTFVSYMKKKGWRVLGLEPDEGAREMAEKTYGISLGTMEQLSTLPPGTFHVITLWHVLEHVHALHPYMDRLRSLLKPGGKIMVAVPNYTSGDGGHYAGYWAAYDVPRHLYHFSPASIRKLADMHKLRVESMHPMWYDSFYIALLSEKYKHGRNRLLASAWQGFRSDVNAFLNKEKASSIVYVLGNAEEQ